MMTADCILYTVYIEAHRNNMMRHPRFDLTFASQTQPSIETTEYNLTRQDAATLLKRRGVDRHKIKPALRDALTRYDLVGSLK